MNLRDDLSGLIADAQIQRLFAPLKAARGLVLAVSGGPDSIALMLLAAQWRAMSEEKLPPIFVASVDHALRAEASDEARAVKDLADDMGFPARVLVWEGEKPQHAIQESARVARYQLLAEAAREWGASHIVTAHHRDDQAETVLMRLASGSGIGGLGAMRPLVAMPSLAAGGDEPIILARPLLGLSKAQLEAVVKEAGVLTVDDPSNRNVRFARVRLRQMTAERDALGLSTDRLVIFAQRCARAQTALAAVAGEKFAALSFGSDDQHQVHLVTTLWQEPDEIILRCIALALRQLAGNGGRDHVPLERLERLVEAFQEARGQEQELQRTLHGTIVHMDRQGMLSLSREPTRYRGRKSGG